MIKIISTIKVENENGELYCRHCDIIITDEDNYYFLGVGGLPFEGDLQLILDAKDTELLKVAVSKNNIKTVTEARCLLYNSAWSVNDFQEAVMEVIVEQVGNDSGSPLFDAIIEKYEAICEEWPDD